MGLSVVLFSRYSWAHWIEILPVALLFLAFFAAVRGGWALWRNEDRGWRWARWLYALQIPFVVVPGLAYHYLIGVYICLIAGNADDNLKIGLGADAKARLDQGIEGWALGVNLFALGAWVWLVAADRRRRMQREAVDFDS